MFFYEFLIVIAAMILGARFGGVFFGMCGGVGPFSPLILNIRLGASIAPDCGHAHHDERCACSLNASEFGRHGIPGSHC